MAMKKSLFIFAAICAAAAVSCTPKELVIDTPEEKVEQNVKLIPITITASFESAKADMVGNVWTWQAGDKLAVFDGTAKREFALDESAAGSAVAKFTGEVAEGFTSLSGVFPYSAAGDSYEAAVSIPAVQTVGTQSADPLGLIAKAEGEKVSDTEYNFYFQSAVSLLKFTAPAGATKVIIHTAAKDETIAGTSPSVTVNLGSAADGTKVFWAAVNPASYTGIHVFTLGSDGKYAHLVTDNTIDLSTSGKGKNLGTVKTVTAGGTEVAVIEDGDDLVSYLGSATAPTLDAFIVNDLNLTGKTVTSCATYAKTFDGLWHSIGNWTSEGVALFTLNTGTIKDFTIGSSCVLKFPATPPAAFAFVACNHKGTMSGITNNAPVKGEGITIPGGRIAVIAGLCDAKDLPEAIVVSNCINNGNVTITTTANTGGTQYIGTIIGSMGNSTENVLADCTNNGKLSITCSGENTKNFYIGGVAGGTTNGSNNIRLKNTGDVTFKCAGHEAALCLSGITSYTTGLIDNCENTGAITFNSEGSLKATFVSGIAGYFASNTMEGCTNRGNITIEAARINGRNNIGDIDGSHYFQKNSETNAVNDYGISAGLTIGGLVSATGKNPVFSNSHNHGTVTLKLTNPSNSDGTHTAARPSMGGLVGDCAGPMTDCNNYGDVKVSLGKRSAFKAKNAGYTLYVGGIVGSSYNFAGATSQNGTDTNKHNKFKLDNCNNSGDVYVYTDNTHTTAHTVGGIVGWPQSEDKTAVYVAKNCTNTGNISCEGGAVFRIGGIHGGTGRMENCKNTGKVTVVSSAATSTAGSISGFHSQAHTFSKCIAEGTVEAKNTIASMGGLVGTLGNVAFEGMDGCSVNCTLIGGPTNNTGLVVGKFNGTTKVITLGSDDDPIEVAGSVNGTAISSSNYADFLYGTTGFSEDKHTVHGTFGN